MTARTTFWGSLALLAHTHLLYPLSLAGLRALRRPASISERAQPVPFVSLIVAAHDEEDVIERKLADALALEWPRERLELIVVSDGSSDRTVERARSAGADLVLDLPRGGKIAAQNAAAAGASGELLAFSDANCFWHPRALVELVAPFADPEVGYVCGQVRFTAAEGDGNEEGAYWRYELWVRALESDLAGVTAGNGGIYAVRASAYPALPPSRSHDLNLPFMLAKRGQRSRYAPAALAEEKQVPTLEGEFARKRRMMRGLWDIVIADRMIDPRGYPPLYAYEVLSHRLLRYASPLLHVFALLANLRLLGRGRLARLALAVQLAVPVAALAPAPQPRLARLCRYYVLTTASIGLGTLDRLREGPPAAWERAEGTR
jgi:cellulose synthase/poly-beta-1,6-N-acetylglucosamine synthase-like glycosyltransferase